MKCLNFEMPFAIVLYHPCLGVQSFGLSKDNSEVGADLARPQIFPCFSYVIEI